MKSLRYLLLAALLLSTALSNATSQVGKRLHDSYAGSGNANGDLLSIAGYTTATYQVSGTFSGTIIPEVSLNGVDYNTLTCFQMDGTTPITSFVTSGSWRCNITGHTVLRARVSSYASGSITVHVNVTDGGTAITKLNGGGGGGGGGGAPTITVVDGSNSPYTVSPTDFVLLCDTSGASRVINLIAATNKVLYQFKNLGANSCTINRGGADLIDGGTTATLTVQYEAIGLYSNGSTSWNVF